MAEILAEVDAFDANITVPDGEDFMDNAAEVVAALASKLANRTYNLGLHKAARDAANTYTANNTFTALLSVLNGLLLVEGADANTAAMRGALPDPSSDFTNYIELQSGSAGLGVRIYTGSSGAVMGGLVIAYNAQFTKGVGWSQTVPSQPSIALIMRYSDLRLVSKPAGSPTWASWQQSTVSAFGATFLSEVVRGARCEAIANTNLDQSQGYRFTGGPIARTSPIPLGTLWGNTLTRWADGHIQRNVGVGSDYDVIWIPIRIPPYCSFGTVRVHFYQLQSSQPDQFQLCKRIGSGPFMVVGSTETHGTFGETVASLHTGGLQVVHDDEEWAYRWRVVSGDGAANLNRIAGAEVDWSEVALSNRVG